MNRLKLMRYERGLTQAEVAQACGIAVGTLKALERGGTTEPHAPTAKAVADFYGVTVADLLGVKEKAA